MPKLFVKKSKHLLYIINKDTKQFVRFNLKERRMERQHKSTDEWIEAKQLYKFFNGFCIHDLDCDEKFQKLLRFTKSINYNCKSLSSFFIRMADIMIYENYFAEGLNATYSRNYTWSRRGGDRFKYIKHPMTLYGKNGIKVLKLTQKEITPDFEETFIEHNEYFKLLFMYMAQADLNEQQMEDLMYAITTHRDKIQTMTKDFNYDLKALLGFVVNYLKPFENVTYYDGINLLHDYYDMAHQVGRKVKKYPKYLKSMHDIIKANYESYKKEYAEDIFLKRQKPELEFNGKEFSIINPITSKDIVNEGTSLNHCVSSYVDRIIEGKVLIIFLRRTKTPEDSLITVEFIGGKITQARGSYNRSLEKTEFEFLEKFCKEKEIELMVKK